MVNQQAVTIESVRQFAEEVKKQGVKLRQVFLFGSYARGGAREWSDVDVALVADEFVGVSFEDIKRFIDVTPFKSPTSFLNCNLQYRRF